MKNYIEIDKGDSIQITTTDERWYYHKTKGQHFPSVTWICSYWPKGKYFNRWLGSVGNEEAAHILQDAGDLGQNVHNGIETLNSGGVVNINGYYTLEEYEYLMRYAQFAQVNELETISAEDTIYSEEHGYMGTRDWLGILNGELCMIDWKTSNSIHYAHHVQLAAYRHEHREKYMEIPAYILHLTNRTKKGWRLIPCAASIDDFLSVKAIWDVEVTRKTPIQRDYPKILKIKSHEKYRI